MQNRYWFLLVGGFMSKEIDTPVPEFLGSDNGGSTFVDNSTTINKTFVKSSSGRSRQSRYAAGGFSLVRVVACVLLIAMLFSFMYRGTTDGWSFTRVLQILQDVPNVATPIIDFFNKGVELVTWDYSGNVVVIQWIANAWNSIAHAYSLIGFCAAASWQTMALLHYLVRVFLFG